MNKQNAKNTHSLYDVLYAASEDNILWGTKPGRLIPLIPELTKGRTVLEAGCGDGKNALFLEQNGFTVTGFDSSNLAINGLTNRFRRANWLPKGNYIVANLLNPIQLRSSDVLISYGVFHCLPELSRIEVHRKLQKKVALGGLVVFTCLTNKLPLPEKHTTQGVTLAGLNEITHLFDGWEIEYCDEGIIVEEHYPIVGQHYHTAIWIIARRVNR
jgi:tellurite methyltransferase